MTELKKRVLKDNVANITRSGKHYKLSFLEKDPLGRNTGEGSKLTELKGKEEKKEKDKDLTQLKKTQVDKIEYNIIPRARNQFADALATLASMVGILKGVWT